jgi:phosphoribosylformylglycinamidine synthase
MVGSMTARVYVNMKPSVLDPQGQTIRTSLNSLGHHSITGVRQGKFFEIQFADGIDRQAAEQELKQISQDILSNPVIEEYRLEIID